MPMVNITCTTAGTGGGTTGGACGSSVFSGMPTTLIATPNVGSTFAGWSGDVVCANSLTVPNVANVSCTANFNGGPPPVNASVESSLALALTFLGITAIAGFKKWRNKT